MSVPNLADISCCTGCGACAAVCPRAALVLKENEDGFLVPQVVSARCVNCGACERVCEAVVKEPEREPVAVYAAQATDPTVRTRSASGGVFALLAHEIISEGGCVVGAAYQDGFRAVSHVVVESPDEIQRVVGSKYLQSNSVGAYAEVVQRLRSGRKVLFSGTPCQVLAMRRIARHYGLTGDLLITAEIICHSVPGGRLWREYLAELEGERNSSIRSVRFKDKEIGWHQTGLRVEFEDGSVSAKTMYDDPYLRAYLKGLVSRKSCGVCPCKSLRSGADFTLGDYWAIGSDFPEMDDELGTSLVLVNSSAGRELFERIQPFVRVKESTFAAALRSNPPIACAVPPDPRRDMCLRDSRTEPALLVLPRYAPKSPSPWVGALRRLLRKIFLR